VNKDVHIESDENKNKHAHKKGNGQKSLELILGENEKEL